MVMFRLSWSQSCSYFLVHDVTKLCTWVTRRVLLMGQKLLTLPNHLRFASVFFWDLYCSDFFFYVVTGYFVDTFFFSFVRFAILLSVLIRFMANGYPFGIFTKLFWFKTTITQTLVKIAFLVVSVCHWCVYFMLFWFSLLLLNHSSYTNLRCSVHCQK